MRIFVTGGAGFIGSNFIRWVLADTDDVEVTNFDLLTYAGNLDTLREVDGDPRYRFVHGDIRDADAVTAVMEGHDAVVNFAAESHVDRSIEGPATFLSTNVSGAGVVFDAARTLGVERFLHISTDEVYGSIAEGSFHEDDGLFPNSPYSASKAGADLLARAYDETYDYPILVTRTTNNFGPFQYPEKVIPLFVTNLMAGESVPLYGDGSNVRDWLYVMDNAEAQWRVLVDGEPGTVYNVGAGNELSNLELTREILTRFDVGDEMIERVADRPGHDLRYSVDTARIRDLGWEPRHSFGEALDATVDWYRDNEWWWRPLKDAGASQRRGLSSS
ncbi:MAG: dTDP-glucose 4,6-dehydratase [Nitriliruptorales bacterium]|nr:dTDP-glucose 4,6-dehydratase [Nitriliruptorales bacterium]